MREAHKIYAIKVENKLVLTYFPNFLKILGECKVELLINKPHFIHGKLKLLCNIHRLQIVDAFFGCMHKRVKWFPLPKSVKLKLKSKPNSTQFNLQLPMSSKQANRPEFQSLRYWVCCPATVVPGCVVTTCCAMLN